MKTNVSLVQTTCKWLAVSGIAAALAACGGGSTETVTTTPVVTISGTAATGAALGGATVTVTCKSGTGTATADANGKYTVSVQGTGPCVLTATSNGVTYSSITPGSGTVNIDPLTTMLTNYLAQQAGVSPTAFAANPNAILGNPNGASIISNAAAISAGEAAIASTVQTTFGVTLSTDNFLSATITPGSSATDQDLVSLQSAGAVSASGGVTPAANTAISDAAANATPYVAPSGATGGTGS
jgi:hypothetical protein